MKLKLMSSWYGSCKQVIWTAVLVGIVAVAGMPLVTPGQTSSSKTGDGSVVSPVQITVQCGNSTARVKTIADGLKLAANLRSAVLLISGTCRENVSMVGLENITLQGNPTATIDGSGTPDAATVLIDRSVNIALSNLTIIGSNNVGIDCERLTFCLLTQVTLENNSVGAGLGQGARLEAENCTVQNNSGGGVEFGFGSAYLNGGTISGNGGDGIFLGNDAVLVTGSGLTIQNNTGNGITAVHHNTIRLTGPTTIAGNGGDGVNLQMASTLITGGGNSITGNAGHQVRIGDLSIAQFLGRSTVSGTKTPDVVCDPVYSATRGIATLLGTTTNCPAEVAAAP